MNRVKVILYSKTISSGISKESVRIIPPLNPLSPEKLKLPWCSVRCLQGRFFWSPDSPSKVENVMVDTDIVEKYGAEKSMLLL